MSPRRRRKKKSAGARLRPFWFLIALVAVAAAFGGYYAATWPGFYPKSIAVAGNRVVPVREILARAQISSRENIWLQSMHAAASRVAGIPYVRTAEIRRGLPASVRITVEERRPYVKLRYQDGAVLADRDLRVLQPASGQVSLVTLVLKAAAAPRPGTFVKQQDAVRLRDDYDALTGAHVVVASLAYDKFDDLVATMPGGVQLLLGDDRLLDKTAPLVGPILSQVAAGGRKIAQVDLRAPKTPVVVFKK